MVSVSRAVAERVMARINNYFNPKVPDDLRDVIPCERMYPDPVLHFNQESGLWEIWWEDGPDNWAQRFDGEPSEESCALLQDMAEEFGFEYERPPAQKSLVLPLGVDFVPITSFGIALVKEGR